MKYYLFNLLYYLFACNNSSNSISGAAKIYFNKDTASFGTIKKGDTAFVGFAFVNSGKLPLKILDVSASCGCTKPRYDSAKIYKPGEDGIIEIGYYSKVDTGNILKNLVVKTNSETMLKVLYIRGFVQ